MTRKTRMHTTQNSLQPLSFVLLSVFYAVLILSSGCSRSDSKRHRFRIYKENGVTIAETTGGPKYDEDLFEYESVLILNQNPQIEESLIFSVRSMTMDKDGSVYVVDYRNYRIAVFDREGNYLRSFGRRGSGPGEFQWIEIVQFDGEIFTLWDANNQRMSRFHRNGTFLEVQSPPHNMRASKMCIVPENKVMVWKSSNERRDGFAYTSALVYVFNTEGDTTATIESDRIITGSVSTRSGPGGSIIEEQRSIPFVSYPYAEYHPGRGIMITTGVRPEVHWYDITGKLVHIHRIDIAPRRITNEIKQSYREDLRRRIQEQAEQAGREPRPFPEQDFPEYAAHWRGGFVDDAGYTWLFVMILPGDEVREGITCSILNPNGRYLGRTTIPNARSTIVRGHLLAAIEDEETGEQIPTVYRIIPAMKGFNYP